MIVSKDQRPSSNRVTFPSPWSIEATRVPEAVGEQQNQWQRSTVCIRETVASDFHPMSRSHCGCSNRHAQA